MNGNEVMFLAIFTIGTVLLLAIWSYLRAKSAKDHHEGAAVDQRMRSQEPRRPVAPEKRNDPPRPMPPPD